MSDSIYLVENLHGLDITIPKDLVPQFKQLVSKALNAWPDCHPALKEFGDMLEHGKVLQNYYSQRTDIKKPKEHPDAPKVTQTTQGDLPICPHCGGKGAHHMHNCKVITGER